MGQGSSSSSKINTSFPQLNDSLYELHRPAGMPSMQILFFHGFQLGDYEGAHLSTWESRDGSCIWPQKWLAEEFPDAHILSVSYHASLTKKKEYADNDLFVIAENIMSDVLQAKIGQEVGSQVILVGHNFGGLVMKEVCLHAQKKASFGSSEHEIFLRSVKGLFFYATPHRGITLKLAQRFVNKGPLLEYVKTLGIRAARLNDDFDKLVKLTSNWRTGGLGEKLPMKWSKNETSLLVEEASSRYGDEFQIVLEDHISICRPKGKTSTSFNTLTRFVGRCSNISRILPGNFQHLPKWIVGVDLVLEELKGLLCEANSLGLVGMGGVGKTTLAKALFNDLEHDYEYSCFLKDVKDRKEEIVDLILKNIHSRGKYNAQGCGLADLSEKRLLLVLDDVDTGQDLEILSILRNDYHIHEDSRVLVTSRDSEVLNHVDVDGVHKVLFLSPQASRQLFLAYAFPKGILPSFEKYVDPLLEKCGGLPLTIEVVSKYLCGKSGSIWKQATQALEKAEAVAGFEENIWAKLKLSYDGLEKEEQEMFLDATTMFLKQPLDEAKAAWSIATRGLQDMRWQRLVDLSLVWEVSNVDWRGFARISVGMHEQLASLGRKLAGNHGENGRRISNDNFEGLKAVFREIRDINIIQDVVGLKMYNYARVTSEHAYQDGSNYVTEGSTAPAMAGADNRNKSTMENFSADNSAKVVHHGVGCDGCQMFPIEGARFKSSVQDNYDLCLSCFKKSGGNASKYSRIDQCASHQANLLRIPGSTLCKMERLRYLRLWNVDIDQTDGAAATLPSTLVYLFLSYANFAELPFNPSHHEPMAVLSLYRCHELGTLPPNLDQLSSLQILKINCAKLESLPPNLDQLSSLQILQIDCAKLESLPDSLGRLPKLKELEITGCSILAKLPETLGDLVALESLTLWSCYALSALPESIGRLRMLKDLFLQKCRCLHELPKTFLQLQGLENICLRNTSLHSIPSLENLGSLKTLQVQWEDSASFPNLPMRLQKVISEQNYLRGLRLKVSNGQFVSVAHFN